MILRGKNISIAVFIFLGLFFMPILLSGNVYGETGTGVQTDCDFPHAYIHICDNTKLGGKDGGASWRIYNAKTYSSNTQYAPQYLSTIMAKGDDVGTIASTCAGKNYDYFVVYGWDGRTNGLNNGTDFAFYGPIQWKAWYKNGTTYYPGNSNYVAIDYNPYYGARTYDNYKNKEIWQGASLAEDTAKTIYTNLINSGREPVPGKGLTSWNSFHGSFFCVPSPDAAVNYYGKSMARINSRSTISTGVTDKGTEKNDSIDVYVNESADLLLTHALYSSVQITGTKGWAVERSFSTSNNDNYNISANQACRSSNPIGNFNTSDGSGHYSSGNVSCSDGKYNHLARDSYKVTFRKAGTYNFCEYLHLDSSSGKKLSGVCLKINVKERPWKITNTAVATISKTKVYAGEKFSVNYGVDVSTEGVVPNPKDYPEAANNASVKSTIYIKEGGFSYDIYSNSGVGLGTSGLSKNNMTYNVPDVKAGSQICIRTEVTPHIIGTMSGTDSGTNYSEEKCATIAKKPSFQVWGGNVFTAGNVKTAVSEKYNVARNGNSYKLSGGEATVFGSWAELGIIHKGTISGLASGDAIEALNGSKETKHCKRGPLTISNECSNDMIKENGNIVDPGDRKIITEYFRNYSNIAKKGGTSLESDDYTIEEGIIFYSSEGDFTIDNNIEYADGPYSDPKDIPKLIIYAKNIKIACGVKRIDAILIANDTISTCSDGANGNYNDKNRSNQITINGAVIANKIDLGRTYGAATGNNSGIPAEIINYDSSLYLWGGGGSRDIEITSSDGSMGDFVTASQTELPPRY